MRSGNYQSLFAGRVLPGYGDGVRAKGGRGSFSTSFPFFLYLSLSFSFLVLFSLFFLFPFFRLHISFFLSSYSLFSCKPSGPLPWHVTKEKENDNYRPGATSSTLYICVCV